MTDLAFLLLGYIAGVGTACYLFFVLRRKGYVEYHGTNHPA